MTNQHLHVLLLEPYYGGSHRAFLDGLQKNLPFRFTLITLPAKKWKMRMQLAAPWMARKIIKLLEKGHDFDVILCSTFIDTATLRVLLIQHNISIPVALYFHENQFVYPDQVEDPAKYQFAALNFTSALAADSLAFNSRYNLETFKQGLTGYLKKATDMDVLPEVARIMAKSVVLYPGIDYEGFDPALRNDRAKAPVILWNHRWEHDKNPEMFFRTLMDLSQRGEQFGLIVLGQHFARYPEIFDLAEKKLAGHIMHFGYAAEREEYIRLLHQGDIVVSTAAHEFFGIAVLEAVRSGCRPLVPDRLAYKELFPERFRYGEGHFAQALASSLSQSGARDEIMLRALADRYSWQNQSGVYREWLENLQLMPVRK